MVKVVALCLLAAMGIASATDMCSLCVSFLDTTAKNDLAGVRSAMDTDCQSACKSLSAVEEEMSCALICDHVGSDTFVSLIDVSDYIGSQEMCSSHQVCDRAEPSIAMLEVESQQTNGTKKPGNVTINGDMTVTGSLKTKSIRSSALTVNGSITVTHAVRTEFLKADNVKASVVETSTMSSPTGSLMLTGNLNMNNVGAASAFIEAESIQTENLIQNGMRQWKMVAHDDFESGHQGWKDGASFVELSSVAGGSFMGGHCKTANNAVTKQFDNLPEHSHLRVQGRYHFIDSWEGETAFLQIDGKYEWLDTNDASSKAGINIVGGDHPERKFGVPLDVIIPHTDSSVFLSFGSNLDQHACDESFGVDDVMIHVK